MQTNAGGEDVKDGQGNPRQGLSGTDMEVWDVEGNMEKTRQQEHLAWIGSQPLCELFQKCGDKRPWPALSRKLKTLGGRQMYGKQWMCG